MRRLLAGALALGIGLAGALPAWATGTIQDVTNQAWRALPITPTQTVPATDAIYTAGTSGNAACTMVVAFTAAPTTQITLSFMTPGFVYPFSIVEVFNSGTCTGIVGLYRSPH